MATTPSAFFDDNVSGSELSYLLKNVPSGVEAFTSIHTGTVGADKFTGSSKNEIFILGSSDKTVTGGNGYDAIVTVSGSGDKVVTGGNGYDAVVTDKSFMMTSKTSIEAVQLTGSTNAKVIGSSDSNNIVGNAGNNTLLGQGGKDVILGGAGNDKLYGGTGKDVLFGGSGKDTLDGGADNDKLLGGADNDVLKGMTGDDKLFGNAGNDKLFGHSGKDSLVGGDGADRLYGGSGSDTFIMTSQTTGFVDVIADFHKGEDVIDLSATGTKKFSELTVTDAKGGAIVTAKDGTTFKLVGYDADEIDRSFFDF